MNLIVINLKRAKDRFQFMQNQLLDLQIDGYIMEAVDKLDLTEAEKNHKFSLPNGWRFGESILPGEIAVTMSHIKALLWAKDHNWPYVTILEDDVILADDFMKRIKYLMKIIPSDWEHCYLSGYPRANNPKIPYAYNLSFMNTMPSPIVDGAFAYMVNSNAYDKVIRALSKFETTIDDAMVHLIHGKQILKSHLFLPFVAHVKIDYSYISEKTYTDPFHPSKFYFKNQL